MFHRTEHSILTWKGPVKIIESKPLLLTGLPRTNSEDHAGHLFDLPHPQARLVLGFMAVRALPYFFHHTAAQIYFILQYTQTNE